MEKEVNVYYTWKKVQTWIKETYIVNEDDKDKADKIMIDMFNNNFDGLNEDNCPVEWCDQEFADDNNDVMDPYYLDGEICPTFELYSGRVGDILSDNRPLDEKRNIKIDQILQK